MATMLTLTFKYKKKSYTQKFDKVSDDNHAELLSFIENNNLKDILTIIDLGTIAFNNVKERNNISNDTTLKNIILNKEKSIETKYNSKLKELETQYNTKIDVQQNKINKLNKIIQQNDELEGEKIKKREFDLNQIYNSKVGVLNNNIDNLNTQLEKLEHRNSTLRNQLSEVRDKERKSFHEQLLSIRTDGEKSLNELKNHHEKQLSELKKYTEKEKEILRNEKNELSKQIQEKNSQLNILNNSNRKGKEAEQFLYDEIVQCYPCSSIENSSGKASKGDIILNVDGIPILIESKAYSNNVPTKEVSKFIKDVKHNKDVRGGIFYSLYSGVCNKSNFAVDMIDGKPHVYIHNAAENVKIFTKIAVNIVKQITGQHITLTNPVLDEIKNLNKYVNDTIVKIRNYKKTINNRAKEDETLLQYIIDSQLKKVNQIIGLITENKI